MKQLEKNEQFGPYRQSEKHLYKKCRSVDKFRLGILCVRIQASIRSNKKKLKKKGIHLYTTTNKN
jgi:hypothetical protein